MSEVNRLLRSQPHYGQGSPEDDFAYGQGIPADATWRNLIPFAEFGLGMAPVSGEAMSARDAWDASGQAGNALLRGDYGQAASEYLNMGTGLLGAIPGAGIIARGTKRGAAWMDRNLPEGFNRLLDAVYPADPRSTTNIFAGPTAKTADHAALAKAQELAASGASRDDIWRETGWMQGVDGKWKFEIDDSAAQLSGVTPDKAGLFQKSKSGSFTGLDHPEYSAAYGDVPGMYGKYGPDVEVRGSYLGDPRGEGPPYIAVGGPDQNEARSVALHELQHNVQNLEDFATGGNPSVGRSIAHEEGWKVAFKAQDELDRMIGGLSPELQGQWEIYQTLGGDRALQMKDRMLKNADLAPVIAKDDEVRALGEMAQDVDPEAALKAYRRIAGETEARNVQRRQKFNAANRRATPPWETQDVPDDQQIVRFR